MGPIMVYPVLSLVVHACTTYFDGLSISLSKTNSLPLKNSPFPKQNRGHYSTNPNNGIVIREIPQNDHRFVLFDSPKMGI